MQHLKRDTLYAKEAKLWENLEKAILRTGSWNDNLVKAGEEDIQIQKPSKRIICLI